MAAKPVGFAHVLLLLYAMALETQNSIMKASTVPTISCFLFIIPPKGQPKKAEIHYFQ